MTSNDNFYASISDGGMWRSVSVLNQNNLREQSQLDTSLVQEKDRERYAWLLNAYNNTLAVVVIDHYQTPMRYL